MRFTRIIDARRGKNSAEVTTLDAPGAFRARGGDDTVTGSDGRDKVFLDVDGADVSDVNPRRKKAGVVVAIDGETDRLPIQSARLREINVRDVGFGDELG